MPKVEWEKEALDDLNKIDKPVIKCILNKISWVSQHFSNITPESLSGDMAGLFKLRSGELNCYAFAFALVSLLHFSAFVVLIV